MIDGGLGDTVQREVGDRFRVLGSLGTGGSGETFEAIRTSDGIAVALKRLVVAKTRDWKTIELFEREARVLASLSHPAIPVFRESFVVESDAGTCLYLASDLAPGRSLRAWMALGWRADLAEVLRITEFLLGVLTYLHSLSPPVVHRDIKPDNIIRGEDGRLWLVDFGAVRDFSTTIGGGSTVVGTYGYMAPEQFRGQAVPASDVYAVAATLIHLMTGRSPHELPQAKLKVVFRPSVHAPPAIVAWLDRALEPSPEDRFATSAIALEALRSGVVAPTAGARPRSSNVRVGVLLGVLVAIAGSASVVIARDVRAARAKSAAALQPAKLPRLPPRPEGPYEPLRMVRTFQGHMGLVLGVALAPDGKTVATGSDGGVKLWDTASGALLRTLGGHVGKVAGLAYTHDGKQLITGDLNSIRFWDPATGTQLRTIDHPHTAAVMQLALSPDGKTLYSCGREPVAKAWDVESGRELRAYTHSAPLYTLALAPNGLHLVTGAADGTVMFWNASNATRLGARPTHHGTKTVNAIAFAPDGSLVASAGDDHVVNVAGLTSSGAVTPRYSVQFKDEAWGVAFSPDGRFLVSTSKDHSIRVTEAIDGALVSTMDIGIYAATMAFSRDGHSLFVGAGNYLVAYSMTHRGSGTKLPVAPASASDQLPPAKNRAHGLYLEAMSLMMHWPTTSLDDAEGKLDEAVASDPRSQVAWVGRAQLALKRGYINGPEYKPGTVAEAKKHLAHAASLGPKGAEYWSVMAWVARAEKDGPGLRAAIREAYALVPGEPYAALAEADVANREKHPVAGLEVASRVAMSTRRPDLLLWAYQLLADSYTAIGDIDAADAAHRKQIELAPKNPWKHGNYAAFLLHHAGDAGRAIEEAERALALMDYGNARATLAKARVDRGDRSLWVYANPKRARADYDVALTLDKRLATAYYGRAACSRFLAIAGHDPKLVAQARRDLELAVEVAPDWKLPRQALLDLDAVSAAAKGK